MAQNKPLELSEIEDIELSTSLLREWWITATQSLVESVGSLKALELLKPYSKNAGAAAAKYLQDFTGLRSNDIQTVTLLEGAGNIWTLRGHAKILISKDVGTLEIAGCKTNGTSREACIVVCKNACKALCEFIEPNYSAELLRTLSEGDDSCYWTFARKDAKQGLSTVGFHEYFLPVIKKEEMDDYARQVLGELWAISTMILVEQLGSSQAMEALKVRMELSAQTWADRIGSMAQIKGRDLDDAKKVRDFLATAFQKRGDLRLESDKIEGVVKVCPFSNAPPEICYQYLQFINNVLRLLEIPYELLGVSSMTKGDKTCHWTIRKKGELLREKSTEDDALRTLRLRFAQGEITPEQYREFRDVLMEK